mmetsp:Transcript_11185/g.35530  ORF Transcript_11185/g.35530 Transcript_11185/m.35530 type:complete len:237 (+) Transcript_11185:173-883(+)
MLATRRDVRAKVAARLDFMRKGARDHIAVKLRDGSRGIVDKQDGKRGQRVVVRLARPVVRRQGLSDRGYGQHERLAECTRVPNDRVGRQVGKPHADAYRSVALARRKASGKWHRLPRHDPCEWLRGRDAVERHDELHHRLYRRVANEEMYGDKVAILIEARRTCLVQHNRHGRRRVSLGRSVGDGRFLLPRGHALVVARAAGASTSPQASTQPVNEGAYVCVRPNDNLSLLQRPLR